MSSSESAIDVLVCEISIGSDGRLHVLPALESGTDYAFIYRAAYGIGWDETTKTLVAPKPRDWTYGMWYRHLVAAVHSEYSHQLTLGGGTRWRNVPDEIRLEIEK